MQRGPEPTVSGGKETALEIACSRLIRPSK